MNNQMDKLSSFWTGCDAAQTANYVHCYDTHEREYIPPPGLYDAEIGIMRGEVSLTVCAQYHHLVHVPSLEHRMTWSQHLKPGASSLQLERARSNAPTGASSLRVGAKSARVERAKQNLVTWALR